MTMMIEKKAKYSKKIFWKLLPFQLFAIQSCIVLKQISDLTVGFCAIGPFRLHTVHKKIAQTAFKHEKMTMYLAFVQSYHFYYANWKYARKLTRLHAHI